MSFLARLALLLFALLPALAAAQDEGGGSSGYNIGGIRVDVVAANPDAARVAAYRLAQRKAWPLLWARITGGAASSAPRLSDGQLDSMVSGIESQGERFSRTRYIAQLGVVFDRSRAAAWLGGVGGRLQSPPMLLLPVLVDGGAPVIYQQKTAWAAAWQRFRETVTPVDYVAASGAAADNMLLTAWQVKRTDRPSWRNILNRFDTVDVLTAEARLTRTWPGGPVRGLFIARHGPDATVLGRFSLAAADEESLDAMLDTATRRIDEIYADALRDGRLRSEPDLAADLEPIIAEAPAIGAALLPAADGSEDGPISGVEVALATPDAASVSAIETQLRATPGVTGVTMTSLSLGGSSRMLISHGGSLMALRYALDARGLRIELENGLTVVRRRREGDVPIPPPELPRPAPKSPEVTPAPTAEPVPERAPVNLLPRPGP